MRGLALPSFYRVEGDFTEVTPAYEAAVDDLMADGLTRVQAEAVILTKNRSKGRKS